MRNYKDEHNVVAWIYDEYTHPKGLYYKEQKEEPVVVEKKEALLGDLNGDGKVNSKDAKIAKKLKASKK